MLHFLEGSKGQSIDAKGDKKKCLKNMQIEDPGTVAYQLRTEWIDEERKTNWGSKNWRPWRQGNGCSERSRLWEGGRL